MTPVRARTRVLIAAAFLLAVGLAVGSFWLLWGALADYVDPKTATERKDLVNVFVLIVAGVVGTLSAISAIGNFYMSRRNLQQQRELDDQRAQDDALQDYFKQMGELLTTHKLMETDGEHHPLRLLARAQTLTVLRRLEGSKRKSDVALFLDGAGLINRDNTIVNLAKADLSGASLSDASLSGVNLRGALLNDAFLNDAELDGANLSDAFLARTNLSGTSLLSASLNDAFLSHADLSDASLSDADLSGADLLHANVSKEQLATCKSLEGATMPDGTEHS